LDNLTHTLVGLTVAELGLRALPAEKRPTRSYAWTLSAIANNFPDLDILYAPYLSGGMSYLMHHRGHTHTFLMGFLQSVAIFFLTWGWAKWRKKIVTPTERNFWIVLSALGPIIHISLDYLNSYGVHPFWPFDNQWYYGDTLFIIEPSLWLTLIPPLIYATRSKLFRAVLSGFFVMALVLAWASSFLPWGLALALTLLGALAWVACERKKESLAWGMAVASVLIFFVTGKILKEKVKSSVAKSGAEIHDVILSPLPANPFCWSVITVERQGEEYRLRKGIAASVPTWFAPEVCPRLRMAEVATMPRVPASIESEPYLLWTGEWTQKWAKLEELDHNHCGFSAFTHFARAPFIVSVGNQLVVGDARYDTDEDLGFAEFVVPTREPAAESCPRFVPPWKGSLFTK